MPIGRPVKLTWAPRTSSTASSIPDFRVKADVIPGRYNTMWFTASKPGKYHIFCTQYCGTKHSAMIGTVTAMEPADYQAWLSGGAAGGTMAENGAKLFTDLSCNTCHMDTGQGRGPVLKGLYGKQVLLANGQTVDGGRRLHSRVDPEPAGQGRGRLPADHADLPGAGHRGAAAADHRVREVAQQHSDADQSRVK